MLRPWREVLVMVVVGVGACADSKDGVDLTIVAPSAISDAALGNVRSLTVNITGVRAAEKRYAIERLAREERLAVNTSASAGLVDIAVEATSAEGLVVASGSSQMVSLVAGRRSATVVLTTPSLMISPRGATVTNGRKQRFYANIPVDWSVTEPGGGTIDSDGVYTAPAVGTGPFHIVATSRAAPEVTASAMVSVAPPGISLLAGALGGRGLSPGMGSAARLTTISAMTQVGNTVYLGDVNGFVYKLTPPNVVEVIAGKPFWVEAVDGIGQDASFFAVRALTADEGNGILYVADQFAIRKIDLATGLVSTLALSTTLANSRGLQLTDPNTLFVSQYTASVIRKVTISNGMVETIAGAVNQRAFADAAVGTDARFNSPSSLAFDGTTLFIADTANHRVRAIALSGTYPVSTVSGTDSAGCDNTNTLSLPTGLSYSNDGLLVADFGSHVIRKIALPSAIVSTIAGVCDTDGVSDGAARNPLSNNGVALFRLPQTVLQVPDGTYYVGESVSGVLREIDLGTNLVRTPLGARLVTGKTDAIGPSARFGEFITVATDGERVFVGDTSNATVRVIDPQGMVSTLVGVAGESDSIDGDAKTARLSGPFAMVWDANRGRLFISDGSAGVALRVWDDRMKTLTTVAGSVLMTGTLDGVGTAARFVGIGALALDDAGDTLYVGDAYALRRIHLSDYSVDTIAGSFMEEASADGPLGVSRLRGTNVAWTSGTLFVGDGTAIRKWDPVTGILSTVAGSLTTGGDDDGVGTAARFRSAESLSPSGDGALWVYDNCSIRRVDVTTFDVSRVVGTRDRCVNVEGPLPGVLNSKFTLATMASGDLVVTSALESAVLKVRLPVP